MFFLEDMDSSAGPMAMDTKVWSRMPFDVLEKVLLRLPLAAQARCQVVCKAVRSFLSSHRLQRERASLGVSGGRLPIYSLVRSDAIMFKAHLHSCSDLRVPYKVHKLSLSFVPQEFRLSNLQYFGKGVLFLVNGVFKSNGLRVGHRICIVNPLNQTWRRLPDLVVESISQTHSDPLKHVSLMGEEEGVFQVFVLHIFQHKSACLQTDPCYASVSTYSSRTCRWESKLITYPRSFHPSALAELDCVVVGQEYIYALRRTTGYDLERTTEVFRASNGEHVRTLVPPVPLTTPDGYIPFGYKLGLLQLEQGECMVAVLDMFDTSTIVGFPDHDAQHWDDVAALPRDVAMKMVPKLDPTDFDYELLFTPAMSTVLGPNNFNFRITWPSPC